MKVESLPSPREPPEVEVLMVRRMYCYWLLVRTSLVRSDLPLYQKTALNFAIYPLVVVVGRLAVLLDLL